MGQHENCSTEYGTYRRCCPLVGIRCRFLCIWNSLHSKDSTVLSISAFQWEHSLASSVANLLTSWSEQWSDCLHLQCANVPIAVLLHYPISIHGCQSNKSSFLISSISLLLWITVMNTYNFKTKKTHCYNNWKYLRRLTYILAVDKYAVSVDID